MARPKTPLETLLTPDAALKFGRVLASRVKTIASSMTDWLNRRDTYEQQMRDDFSWRSSTYEGDRRRLDDGLARPISIFQLQNDSLNIIGATAEFMAAKIGDDITGTEPFYSLQPEGLEDKELADDLQKHSEWKLRQTSIKQAMLDSIDLASGIGEGVLKIHWETQVDTFETEEVVAHLSGEPLTSEAGEYLGESDLVPYDEPDPQGQESPEAEEAEPSPFAVMPDPQDAREPMEGKELPVEEAGPALLTSMKMPAGWTVDAATVELKPRAIEKTNVTWNNVRADTMHRKDFLCPLTVGCIKESDFVGHRFQMRLSEARTKFDLSAEMAGRLSSNDMQPKDEQHKPVPNTPEATEQVESPERDDPLIEFVECWVRMDPVGDGKMRRMRCVVEMQSERIVEMDYMANRTPDGMLPFFVVRTKTVKNRWYGTGYYERFQPYQNYIDQELNRIGVRNRYAANPLKGIDRTQFAEAEEKTEISFSPEVTLELGPGKKLADGVQFIEMPKAEENTWELLQQMLQVIQTRTGVTSAAQGDVSGLQSTATATGIESILQSGSVLARQPTNQVRDDLKPALLYAVKLIYANMDVDEIFTYFDGNKQQARTLEAVKVAGLDFNVRLLLTRFQDREKVDTAKAAIDIFNQFAALPPQLQATSSTIYRQALRGLGFQDADSIIQPPDPAALMPPGAQGDPATSQPIAMPAAQPAGLPAAPVAQPAV